VLALGGFLLVATVLGNLVIRGAPLPLAAIETGIGLGALGLVSALTLGPGTT
jgi:hypothetical protein